MELPRLHQISLAAYRFPGSPLPKALICIPPVCSTSHNRQNQFVAELTQTIDLTPPSKSSSGLTSLPLEIMLIVFSLLEHENQSASWTAGERMAFALSSKSAIRAATSFQMLEFRTQTCFLRSAFQITSLRSITPRVLKWCFSCKNFWPVGGCHSDRTQWHLYYNHGSGDAAIVCPCGPNREESPGLKGVIRLPYGSSKEATLAKKLIPQFHFDMAALWLGPE